MPNANSAVNNLLVGLSYAGAAQAEADVANRRAHDAEMRAMQAEMYAAGKTTDRDLQRRLDDANRLQQGAQNAAEILKKMVAEKDALIEDLRPAQKAWQAMATLLQSELTAAASMDEIKFGRDAISFDQARRYFEDLFRSAENLQPKYTDEEKSIPNPCPEHVSIALITVKHGGSFVGEHANGMRTGRGVHRWPNGSGYEGTWIEDKLSGLATTTFDNGSVFVGNFGNDLREGAGRHDLSKALSNPVLFREGVYAGGQLRQGEIVLKNGSIKRGSFVFERNEYVLVEGEETALSENAEIGFKGQVKNRQRVGGFFKFSDGTSFDGDLLEPVDDQKSQKRRGVLNLLMVEVNGQFIGFSTIEGSFVATFSDGSVFEGVDGAITADKKLNCSIGTSRNAKGKVCEASVLDNVLNLAQEKSFFKRLFG